MGNFPKFCNGSSKEFPKFVDEQSVFCFNCRLPITGPFQASGFAPGHGAMRGQCTGPRGCGMITYFDFEEPKEES